MGNDNKDEDIGLMGRIYDFIALNPYSTYVEVNKVFNKKNDRDLQFTIRDMIMLLILGNKAAMIRDGVLGRFCIR